MRSEAKMQKKLINVPRNRALTNYDILKITKKLGLTDFRGVFMRDALPKKPRVNESMIINLASQDSIGSHWVCYRKKGNIIVYFDSYGDLQPPKEVIRYLKGAKIFYNYRRFQYLPVECGYQAIRFLVMPNPFSLALKTINT